MTVRQQTLATEYWLFGLIGATDESLGRYVFIEIQPNEQLAQQRAIELTRQDPVTIVQQYGDILIKEKYTCLGDTPNLTFGLVGAINIRPDNSCGIDS